MSHKPKNTLIEGRGYDSPFNRNLYGVAVERGIGEDSLVLCRDYADPTFVYMSVDMIWVECTMLYVIDS